MLNFLLQGEELNLKEYVSFPQSKELRPLSVVQLVPIRDNLCKGLGFESRIPYFSTDNVCEYYNFNGYTFYFSCSLE